MIQRALTIVLILVIVFGGGYYAYVRLVPAPAEVDGPMFSTKPVVRGNITVGVDCAGPLNPSRGGGIQVPGGTVVASYQVEEVLVGDGDPVSQGDLLIRLGAPDLVAQIATLERQLAADRQSLALTLGVSPDQLDSLDPTQGITLVAPIAGRVVGLSVKEGSELKQGQIVARVVDDSRFTLTAKLTPAEVGLVKAGDVVAISFAQFAGWVDGTVVNVNPEPIPESAADLIDSLPGSAGQGYQFVYWVRIEGDNAGLIRPGMLARIGVFTQRASTGEPDPSSVTYTRYFAPVEGYVDEQLVLSTVSAIATKVFVHEMQRVSAGDRLLSLAGEDARALLSEALSRLMTKELEIQQLQTQLTQLDVRAAMDGVIAYLEAQPGMTVQAGQWLGSIYNTSDMMMWVQVDDIDVLLVQQGSPVKVTVAALPGVTFEGEVLEVSTMGKDERGISRFHVTIKVQGGPQLRPGMQAQARIEAGSAEDVLLIPLEAVFEEDGQTRVEVLGPDDTPRVVTVRLGLMDHRHAEVLSGLEEGELVITGSTADLLPSLRIRSRDSLLPQTQPPGGD